MPRSAASVWRAVACSSLLGMTLASGTPPACAPDTCSTETPTIYYNCPTPTIPLSGAPTKSPKASPSKSPTSGPALPPGTPSKAPTAFPTSATAPPTKNPVAAEDLDTAPEEATTSPPTAVTFPPSKGVTVAATSRPTDAPRACQCAVKRGVFNMPMPTYTCPTPAPTYVVLLPLDLSTLSSTPAVAALLATPVKQVTADQVAAALISILKLGVGIKIPSKAPGLPALDLKLKTTPTLTSSGGSGDDGALDMALDMDIDVAQLLDSVEKYKASLQLFFAEVFGVNPSQVSNIVIKRGEATYKRKAGVLSNTAVSVTAKICNAANCASASSYTAPVVPASASAMWATANARTQQTVTLANVQAALTVGENVDLDQNGLKFHFTVNGAPTATTRGTRTTVPATAISFVFRANVNWEDVALTKAASKAAYTYAVANQFTPALNVNQFHNVMFLAPGTNPYKRKADPLARTEGQISQDITQPGFTAGTPAAGAATTVEDDDSSIIAVAVIVPITVIAIVLVIVIYLVCPSEDAAKDAAPTGPYGNEDEQPADPVNTDGPVPSDQTA